MRQWSRGLRIIATVAVVIWGLLVLQSEVVNRAFHNPYDAPTPPYVSVFTQFKSSTHWSTWMWDLGRDVVTFIRFPN
jgi:hypothetical protein